MADTLSSIPGIHILWGLVGIAVVLAIAVLFSTDRRSISLRTTSIALALQIGFGILVLTVPWGQRALSAVTNAVQAVIDSSAEGIDFLFGPILPEEGSAFAFQVLPIIVFFSALTAVLYYLNILPIVVRFLGGALAKVLGTSKPESVNAAANIFVGQVEAPLVIRPYLAGMTRSELFAVMAGGLATVAGSVLVGYSLLGAELEYLIAAAFMAAPGGLLMAKILVPAPKGEPTSDELASSSTPATAGVGAKTSADRTAHQAEGGQRFRRAGNHQREPGSAVDEDATTEDAEKPAPADDVADEPANVIDAAARGASDGLKLAANVGAMLLAFISLIALLNIFVGSIGGWFGADDLTIEQILGYVFAPVMFIVGVPWAEAVSAGSFLGQKIVLNEFIAFADFGPQAENFSPKAQAVITFALTGFANFGSLAILLGGLGGMVAARRSEIASLGLRAILAGTLANLVSAAIAGMLIL